MAKMNLVIIEGVVISDFVEVKKFGEGKRVANFRVVVGDSRKDSNGNWVRDEKAVFINCFRWDYDGSDKLVALMENYFTKGARLIIQGQLVQDNWVDSKTGEQRSDKKLKVDKVTIISWGERRKQGPSAIDVNDENEEPEGNEESVIPF